jgi:hypothetical protein
MGSNSGRRYPRAGPISKCQNDDVIQGCITMKMIEKINQKEYWREREKETFSLLFVIVIQLCISV